MKIGIISDTHGCYNTWQNVFNKFFFDADYIIHAGDVLYHGPRNSIVAEYNPQALASSLNECKIPLIIARGNCDAEVDSMVLTWPVQSPYAYILHDGLRLVVNHGNKLTENMKHDIARKMKANIFITGHTHDAEIKSVDDIIFLNPGSPGMSKRKDKRGTAAIIQFGKVVVFDVSNGEEIMSAEIIS